MEKQIIVNDQPIKYHLKRRQGMRGIRISIRPWGEITVTTGKLAPQIFIDSFLRSKSVWLQKTLSHLATKNIQPPIKYSPKQIKELKAQTLTLLDPKLDYYGGLLGVTWEHVSIRNQSTRWGSCSRSGNLNFNFRLAKLPDELVDYIVVHELAHLRELNHSARFWALVAHVMPDYKSRVKALKKQAIVVS